jgi:Cell wall-active antibiotics response 4TMS YvqF/Domain of unknown function (DUF5668)
MPAEIRNIGKAIVFPLFVVIAGVVFLLDQLGVASAARFFDFFWPALLLYFGLAGLLFGAVVGRFWGSLLTIAGVILLLNHFGYHINFDIFWPIAIILWGLWLLGIALTGKSDWKMGWARTVGDSFARGFGSDSNSADPELVAVFASVKRRITAPNFRGGKAVAIFGEVKLDLTKAEIEGYEATLEATGVFGAVEVRVPEKWEVSVRGAAILGEYQDRLHQHPEGTPPKRLVIKGGAVFGSVVVKND